MIKSFITNAIRAMRKMLMLLLMVLLAPCVASAQNMSQFKVLSDSAYLTDAAYQAGNKYQKDAILFMDMVADTHPYYIGHRTKRI